MSDLQLNTKGRVLNHGASIYDYVQPVVTFGQEKKLNKWLAERLCLKQHSEVLDIGCGTGLLTVTIADLYPHSNITGLDASRSMIQVALKKRSRENCNFLQGLGEHLPFENETLDVITSALFFHHINQELKKKCLKECLRVLKPGGKLFIADMNTPYTFLGKITSILAWKLLFQPEIKENMDGLVDTLVKETGFINHKITGKFSGYISVTEAEKEMP